MDLFENLDRIFISKGEGSFEEWPLLLACLTFYLALRLLIKAYEEPLGRLDMRTTIWWRKIRDRGRRSVAKGIRRVLVFVILTVVVILALGASYLWFKYGNRKKYRRE
jgi:hypothetical protein